MFAINQPNFQLSLEVIDSENLGLRSIQTEIHFHLALIYSEVNLVLNSVWFDWHIIEAFFSALRQMIDTNKGFSEIEDMSNDIFIRFSKSNTATLFTFRSKQRVMPLTTTFTFSTEVDADTINIIYRQLVDVVRELRAIFR